MSELPSANELNQELEKRLGRKPIVNFVDSPPPAPTHAGEQAFQQFADWRVELCPELFTVSGEQMAIICENSGVRVPAIPLHLAKRVTSCVNFCSGLSSAEIERMRGYGVKAKDAVETANRQDATINNLKLELEHAIDLAADLRTQLADLRKKLGESEAKALWVDKWKDSIECAFDTLFANQHAAMTELRAILQKGKQV